MFRRTPLATAIHLALVANAIAAASPILAQTPKYEDPSRAADDTVEEIIVTGTRIAKDIYSSALPVEVLYTEEAQLDGVPDVAELLQRAPIALGSAQQTFVESSFTGWANEGGVGVSTLSLRGIGANRTLVLLNGRRAGPAGTRGAVSSFDLGVLPITAIERVEILKDGASSIYGSDAIAGVVNFITRQGDGLSLDMYATQAAESGGEVRRMSASWGKTFSRGRFHVTGAYHQNRELEEGDRDYFECSESYIFDPETGDRADAIDPRTGKPSCGNLPWGHVWLYDYQEPGGNVPWGAIAQYDYDGDLGDYLDPITADPDDPLTLRAPPGWYLVWYDKDTTGITNMHHPFEYKRSVAPEIERVTVYADGELDLADSVQLYAETLLNRRETTRDGYRQFWSYVYNEDFFGGNPQSEGWTGAQFLSPTAVTDHSGLRDEVEYRRYVLGLRGELSPDWSYDVSIQHSRSIGDYAAKIIYDDSIEDQNWLHGSCAGMTATSRPRCASSCSAGPRARRSTRNYPPRPTSRGVSGNCLPGQWQRHSACTTAKTRSMTTLVRPGASVTCGDRTAMA
jgi:iron complex outermembrane receptor protein